jgi:O-antigen/teichoic acid export membrane protein
LVGLLVLGLILEHDWTIRTIYGRAFGPASLILLWLAPAFGFMGLNFLLGGVLSAGYRQRTLLWATIAGAVVNVPLNAVLIPRNGAFGAAIATVVTEALVTAIMFFHLPTQVGGAAVVRPFGRIALWLAALVGFPTVVLHPYLPVAARISLEFGSGLLFLGVLVRRDEIPNLWARGRPAVVDP